MGSVKQAKFTYEAIVEADKRGELWPKGQCLTTGCSAEMPIPLGCLKARLGKKTGNPLL